MTSISGDYLNILKKNFWKGNIRELRNIIERSVILEDSEELSVSSLPFDMQQISTAQSSSDKTLSAFLWQVQRSFIFRKS
jgi:DNA-binding NtrC family response regulator